MDIFNLCVLLTYFLKIVSCKCLNKIDFERSFVIYFLIQQRSHIKLKTIFSFILAIISSFISFICITLPFLSHLYFHTTLNSSKLLVQSRMHVIIIPNFFCTFTIFIMVQHLFWFCRKSSICFCLNIFMNLIIERYS